MSDTAALCQKLGHQFSNPDLLTEALSHRSIGSKNYERMEFLGDGFLNFIIASEIFAQSAENEGAMSRLRASLVRESTLADIARELKLGDYLIMGVGELRSGGFDRDSILSDVVESIVGAVYLDSGFDTAKALVLRLYGDRIKNLPPSTELKDPKTRLQERLQSQNYARPDYQVVAKDGQAHNMQFTVNCTIAELHLTTRATASSRRKAEQSAAALMLEKLPPNIRP